MTTFKKANAFFIAMMILFSTTISSCLGSFSAFNGLKDWNQGVADNKFVNNFIFWVLYIIPVYQLFLLGDLIIFNLLEFWTGDNPIAMKEGESQSQYMTYNGKTYQMIATKNQLALFDADGNLVQELLFEEETKTWMVSSDGTTQKVVSLEGVQANQANYRVYSGDCEEGTTLSVNTQDLLSKGQLMQW